GADGRQHQHPHGADERRPDGCARCQARWRIPQEIGGQSVRAVMPDVDEQDDQKHEPDQRRREEEHHRNAANVMAARDARLEAGRVPLRRGVACSRLGAHSYTSRYRLSTWMLMTFMIRVTAHYAIPSSKR